MRIRQRFVGSITSLALGYALVGCGLLGGGRGDDEGARGSSGVLRGGASSGSSGTAGDGESSAEIRALVTEALTPQLCPKLLGSFVGLPGEGTARGPAAGTLPTAGRWWIRRCTARVNGERLELSLGGSGWTWVDREASGFRIRQYMLFETDVQLSADVSVGYDRQHRIASLWMTPAEGVSASVQPRGVVTAEPTGIFSAVVGGILPITGASASDRARAQAEQLGSQQMRERLAAGFTMTFDLGRRQVDFMVGALSRGEVPQRPYGSEGLDGPWQLNQRVSVQPGGLDVIGPVDLATAQGLDVQLEEGEGAVLQTVCAEPMGAYLENRLRGATARPPVGNPIAQLTQGGPEMHVTLASASCPTLLLVAPRPNATLPIKLRLRVANERSGAGAESALQRLQRVRVQVAGVTVRAQTAANHDWDVVGGEADVYVSTASVPLGRQIDRTPTVTDHNTATWDRWLPGTYDAARDFPLRFTVYDEDSTSDEVVGYADLDAAGLPAQAGDLSLPIRSGGAIPMQMGTLRLRLEAVP